MSVASRVGKIRGQMSVSESSEEVGKKVAREGGGDGIPGDLEVGIAKSCCTCPRRWPLGGATAPEMPLDGGLTGMGCFPCYQRLFCWMWFLKTERGRATQWDRPWTHTPIGPGLVCRML